jgi:hypothetical protein
VAKLTTLNKGGCSLGGRKGASLTVLVRFVQL